MLQADAHILEVAAEGNGPFVRVAFDAPGIAEQLAPGRFVLAELGGVLREVVFPARIESAEFEALVVPSHPAADLQRGARVNLIGPLGRGFEVNVTARRLLLVATAHQVPVLLPLARSDALRSQSVALLLAAPSAADLYPLRLLPPSVEVHIVTVDGSAGRAGNVVDAFPGLVPWADQICIAGDPRAYATLAQAIREMRVAPPPGFAQALVAPAMACGVGACRGCAVATTRGVQLACTDGPVFDLLELD